MSDYDDAVAGVAAGLTVHEPAFSIPVGIVDDYRSMALGEISATIDAAGVPEVASQRGRLIVHGYAGSGKTELIHRVFRRVVGDGGYATLVRLRELTPIRADWDALQGSPPAQISLLLSKVAQPPVEEADISQIAAPFFVLVDGLDEVPKPIAVPVLNALDDLAARVPNVVVVVTDRFTSRPIDSRRWTIASLRPLEAPAAGELLDYDSGEVPPLLRIPVFADLALQGQVEADAGDDRRTMVSLIRPYLAGEIGDDVLPAVADAAFDVFAASQSRIFPIEPFQEIAGGLATQSAIDKGVIRVDGSDASFVHNLVHDYLAAYSLASHPERWNQNGFDAVAFKASSFDVLVLCAEVLAEREAGEQIELFVQQLYDWSFYAVGFVLARCVSVGSEALPGEVFTAVESMLAERRWDLVASTAGRVEDALRLIGNQTAVELLALENLLELQTWVAGQPGSASWYQIWRELFLTPPSAAVDVDFVTAVNDALSISGWTAANVVKRTNPTDAAEEHLRSLVSDVDGTVRWRAAHALGAFPTPANVDALFNVLSADPYPWARYGAIRSLIEQAARADAPELRSAIIERLVDHSKVIAEQPLLVTELSDCVVVTNPPEDWVQSLRPLLKAMWAASSGENQQLWDRTELRLEAADVA